jgi:uncharacterized membrane protein YhiD involved in acid resistance
MMSFKDIFKKSFLDGYAGMEINSLTVAMALLIASALAFYIFLVYRVITRKTFYSKNFNISLAAITVTTAALILTMQSSVVLSLGMVGALSIVRFRTAIKDPMDLIFLFWAISVGIICGAGLAQIAIVLCVVLTIGILVLNLFPVVKAPMILVVNASDLDVESKVEALVTAYDKHFKIKSRNMTATSLDMVIELRTSKGGELVRSIMKEEGILSASLLSHDGEVTF